MGSQPGNGERDGVHALALETSVAQQAAESCKLESKMKLRKIKRTAQARIAYWIKQEKLMRSLGLELLWLKRWGQCYRAIQPIGLPDNAIEEIQ